jgi:hypothetical protein
MCASRKTTNENKLLQALARIYINKKLVKKVWLEGNEKLSGNPLGEGLKTGVLLFYTHILYEKPHFCQRHHSHEPRILMQ